MLSFVLWLALLAGPAPAETLLLLMFEQPGCNYCARWNAEIAPEYSRTEEVRAAPLHRLQLRDEVPDEFSLASPPVFTPTFVLVVGGTEGYPGEHFSGLSWPG